MHVSTSRTWVHGCWQEIKASIDITTVLYISHSVIPYVRIVLIFDFFFFFALVVFFKLIFRKCLKFQVFKLNGFNWSKTFSLRYFFSMCEEEKRRLVIPSDLGYGQRGAPPKIPGNCHSIIMLVHLIFQT